MPRFRSLFALFFSTCVFFFSASLLMRLTYGQYACGEYGPCWPPIESWQTFMQNRGLPQIGYLCSDAMIYSPAFVLGLASWGIQQRSRTDGHLHCTKCGHILKGLTAPRCPECGTII